MLVAFFLFFLFKKKHKKIKEKNFFREKKMMYSESDKCQVLFWRLVKANEKWYDVMSSDYIRAFWQTKECDQYNNLRDLRYKYKKHMGKSTLKRIKSYDSNKLYEDEKRAFQSVMHYRSWATKRLLEGFTWKRWLYYHSVHKAKKKWRGVIKFHLT
jgi:hypothetical protein